MRQTEEKDIVHQVLKVRFYSEAFLIHKKKHLFQKPWLLLGRGRYSEGRYGEEGGSLAQSVERRTLDLRV